MKFYNFFFNKQEKNKNYIFYDYILLKLLEWRSFFEGKESLIKKNKIPNEKMFFYTFFITWKFKTQNNKSQITNRLEKNILNL
jgi:hypothetical protein